MVFDTLFQESIDQRTFADSLKSNFRDILTFYNLPLKEQKEQSENVNNFIIIKQQILTAHSYDYIEGRSFFLILFDLCEFLQLTAGLPIIERILNNKENHIEINSRRQASILITKRAFSNDERVKRFEPILELLDTSIKEDDEDNENKVLATLLNYYCNIVIDNPRHPEFATQVHDKIQAAINSGKYEWLSPIEDVLGYNYYDTSDFETKVNEKIDSILGRISTIANEDLDNFLIETDEDSSYLYATGLEGRQATFKDIYELNRSCRDMWINDNEGNQVDLKGHGTDLLETEGEMFEYIKRYGQMHNAKLVSAFEDENGFPQKFDEPIDIVDWGCGQALATMAFIEKYGNTHIRSITLIEPSETVIKRAALHCKKFAPNATIRTIVKKLDDLLESDFALDNNSTLVNLFSNILDIDDYDVTKLATLVDKVSLGKRSFFICVSPYRDDIKTSKIQSFVDYFSGHDNFTLYQDKENRKNDGFWMCATSSKFPDKVHGKGDYCHMRDGGPCKSRWTRVVKVFSI